MRLVLLSGLDGTGKLFSPFIEALPSNIKMQVIAYPSDQKLSYMELYKLVLKQLPKDEKFVLLAESFSGYVAYLVALQKPKNLKSVIFVATFLENPRPVLSKFLLIVPMKFIFSLPIPNVVAKGLLLGRQSDSVELLKNTLKGVSPSVLYHRLLEIVHLPLVFEKLDVKAIYIQASDDILVPKCSYKVFEKYVSDIELYEVEGTHLLLQGNTLACVKIVEKFLKEEKNEK